MSEMETEWQAPQASNALSQKLLDHQFVVNNLQRASLTPDERYQVEWGPDALSESWIRQKATDIQKQIEDSNSTAILRKGLARTGDANQAAKDAVTAAATEGESASGAPRAASGPRASGPGTWSSTATPTTSRRQAACSRRGFTASAAR